MFRTNRKLLVWTLALMFLLQTASFAQMGMMSGPLLSGVFHPKVGFGALYQITDVRGQTSEMEMAVVGKENVEGTTAYWMELSFPNRRGGGEMIMKYLMTMKGDTLQIRRIIMKNSQAGALEMPEAMNARISQGINEGLSASEKGLGRNLGTEVIATKSGPKRCKHWQKESSLGMTDAWINENVYPTALVKSVTKTKDGNHSMQLIKEITGATTKITEEPKKMEFPGMGRPSGQPE